MTTTTETALQQRIGLALQTFPAVLLAGPHQSGRTTLAKQLLEAQRGTYFDLADPECPLLSSDAGTTLRPLTGLVVIDNSERRPKITEMVRLLTLRDPVPARFLLLSGVAPELLGEHDVLGEHGVLLPTGGLTLAEVGPQHWRTLWTRGRLPRSFYAENDDAAHHWRSNFMQELLERYVPQLGVRTPAITLRRFWQLLAQHHGQPLNASALARVMNARQDTVRRYLEILTGMFMVRLLPPWLDVTTRKRLVKAPVMYVRDSGLLHSLLGLHTVNAVTEHPDAAWAWKGFALEETLCRLGDDRDVYFYKTHAGASLDLLVLRQGKRVGFEFSHEAVPRTTKSMRAVIKDLQLDRLYIVYPGAHPHTLDKNIVAVPIGS